MSPRKTTPPAPNPARFADSLGTAYAKGERRRNQLQQERDKRVKLLRKKKSGASAQVLAVKIKACTAKTRCRSPACPVCADAAQRLFRRAARKHLNGQPQDQLVCVSIVPADGIHWPGALNSAQSSRNVRRWKDALSRAGVEWLVGGLDYSFNESEAGRHQPFWSEHIFGITATRNPRKLKRDLKKAFAKTDAVARPVKVTAWDGGTRALNYLLKPNFWRRVGTSRRNRGMGARKRSNTSKERLRASEKIELFQFLDSLGFQGRLFLRQGQFVNLKGFGPTIVFRGLKP